MTAATKDLWSIYRLRQQLDPRDLTRAIEEQVRSGDLDYRTRLLIHECVDALRDYWGHGRVADWLTASPVGRDIEAIWQQQYDDDVGFPSLRRRVMDVTSPEMIAGFFRDLSSHVHRPLRLCIGGSVACILMGYLSRKTEDIDIVDEVPAEIRSQHQLLARLQQRYDLQLGHFQSHYLPSGWEQRLHSQAPVGQLQVWLVDVYDVFLSKLNSKRDKDMDDLVRLVPQLDKEVLVHRLKTSAQGLFAPPNLRKQAEQNWYVLFGEPLPA
ncbi:MAG TPA: DUF6036 family nucleotidyltransferase [Gemmataceae bacterium]|nr:DUF6036 family nucleotidyltransferase [Gemmataceae bacterium]